MKQLVGLAGLLLATSAGAGHPGRFAMPALVTTPEHAISPAAAAIPLAVQIHSSIIQLNMIRASWRSETVKVAVVHPIEMTMLRKLITSGGTR
jgi:hypothetical protein